jgi:hypothetical protein
MPPMRMLGLLLVFLVACHGANRAMSQRDLLDAKLRCAEAVKTSLRENETLLDWSCYSPEHNTCLAHIIARGQTDERVSQIAVVDLATGEALASYCTYGGSRQPDISTCLFYEADEKKAREWFLQQAAEMEKLKSSCAQ